MALDKTGERIFNSLRNKTGPAIASEWGVYVQSLGENSKLEKLLLATIALLPEKSEAEIKAFADAYNDEGREAREAVNSFFHIGR